MDIYLASISTNLYEIDKKAYKNIDNSLKYIYNNLKKLTTEYIEGCNFFDRDYVQNFFTKEFYEQYVNVNCRNEYGEFTIKKVEENKYQFVFVPYNIILNQTSPDERFIVCELEILDLLV